MSSVASPLQARFPFLSLPSWPVWALALWLGVIGNLPLWQRVASLADTSGHRVALLLSLGLLVVALLAATLSLLHWRRLYRPVASLLVLVAAFNCHFMWQYGVVIDSTMMANVIQTDANEVRDLLSGTMMLAVLAVAGPGLWLIWRTPAPSMPAWSRLGLNLGHTVLALLLAAAALMTGYQGLASLMRVHKDVRYLINPFNTLVASGQLLAHQGRQTGQVLQPVGEDARLGASYAAQARPPLVVVVVGETARARNWGLNGYERATTPELAQWQARRGLVNFPQVRSCGTSTQVSVPCMFSPLARDEGGNQPARSENLLDVLQRAGLAVLWLDNQSGCKGVCERVPEVHVRREPVDGLCADSWCFDEVMLKDLDERIAALDPQRRARGVVVVMHQVGSHGPAYFNRAPDTHKPFQPECRSVTLSDCPNEQVVNAYDNSITYTDHFLALTLTWLQAQASAGRYDTGLVYVSDHGESLGENGLYLHGVPYALAPDDQTRVPMVAWLSDGLQRRSGVRTDCLGTRAQQPVSHDNLFHSVLGLMDVSTHVRQPALDLFTPCDGETINGPQAS